MDGRDWWKSRLEAGSQLFGDKIWHSVVSRADLRRDYLAWCAGRKVAPGPAHRMQMLLRSVLTTGWPRGNRLEVHRGVRKSSVLVWEFPSLGECIKAFEQSGNGRLARYVETRADRGFFEIERSAAKGGAIEVIPQSGPRGTIPWGALEVYDRIRLRGMTVEKVQSSISNYRAAMIRRSSGACWFARVEKIDKDGSIEVQRIEDREVVRGRGKGKLVKPPKHGPFVLDPPITGTTIEPPIKGHMIVSALGIVRTLPPIKGMPWRYLDIGDRVSMPLDAILIVVQASLRQFRMRQRRLSEQRHVGGHWRVWQGKAWIEDRRVWVERMPDSY